MSVIGLSLLQIWVDKILDEATVKCGLTRRAAIALATMDAQNAKSFSNDWLKTLFLKRRLSSEKSVLKDASSAKSELFRHDCLKVVGSISAFSVNDHGHKVAVDFLEAIETAIQNPEIPKKLRRILREVYSPLADAGEMHGKTLVTGTESARPKAASRKILMIKPQTPVSK